MSLGFSICRLPALPCEEVLGIASRMRMRHCWRGVNQLQTALLQTGTMTFSHRLRIIAGAA